MDKQLSSGRTVDVEQMESRLEGEQVAQAWLTLIRQMLAEPAHDEMPTGKDVAR